MPSCKACAVCKQIAGWQSKNSMAAPTQVDNNSTFSFFTSTLLNNSDDLITVIDADLRFVGFNAHILREFELVFGTKITAGQRLDDVLAHLTHDREKAASLCRRALAGESFRVSEEFGDEQLLRKRYELAFSPILDINQRPLFAAMVMRDLTTICEIDQRFSALLEAAPDATIILRCDGTIELANAHAVRMFGYSRHQMVGMPVEKLIPERCRAHHVTQRQRFRQRPASRPMGSGRSDLLGLRSDGTEFPVEVSINPLNLGRDTMVVAAIRDMTLRQNAEEKLRALSSALEQRVAERTAEIEQANTVFRATFEQASVGMAHIAPSGEWLRVNQQLCEIVGYTRQELANLTFQNITHPDDLNADLRLMYKVLAGDIPSYAIDKRYVHKDGRIVWINLNVALVRDLHGAPQYFIAVVRNINDRKRAEAALQKTNEGLELAVEATGLGMFDYSLQTGEMTWNAEMKRHFGLPPEADVTYASLISRIHVEDREKVAESLAHAMQEGSDGRIYLHYRMCEQCGHGERWVEARGQVYFDEKNRPVRCIGTVLDITEKKYAEEAIRESAHQLTLLFSASPVGMVRRTSTGQFIEVNAAFLRLVGRTRDRLLSEHWEDLVPNEHLPAVRKAMQQAIKQGVSDVFEKEFIHSNGQRVPVLEAFAAIGKQKDLVSFVVDISERKQAEERVRQSLLHDPLTGLPNRALLFDYSKHIFAHAMRTQRHSAIMYVDLDRFKPINDNYGHEVGDAVLREVARRLTSSTRADDMVFRLGGDEFLVLLPEITSDSCAGEVARHIIHSLNQPLSVNSLELSISPSIGISIYPRDGADLEALVNSADAAMYQAKHSGRNNVQFYSEELAARSQLQSKVEARLKATLTRDAFQLFYQPLVDIQSGHVVGVEALIRWPYEDVGPEQFVPIAEATGHIHQLGNWVIGEACRQHKQWRERGLPAIPIAVNVSAVQFKNKDFAEQFTQLIDDYSVDVAALQIELTETALMENLDRAVEVLTRLKSLGITISLDDFGTGYSSLNYLSQLPIDKIKVDKSFVQRLGHDDASRAITKAVIALGRTLDLQVVAEGIESEDALYYLREHGCNQAQGYYVCKPVDAHTFEAWYHGQHSKFRH